MTSANKINNILNYLQINAKIFSERLGYPRPQIIYDIQKGKTKSISSELADKITSVFPEISKSWLLADFGEMLMHENADIARKLDTSNQIEDVSVRFFSVTPSATFQEFCSGADREIDTISVKPEVGEILNDTYCVFEVFGKSMAPQIQPKARVLCYEVPPTKWHTLHDCVVVIAYTDRFVIKRLVKNHLDTSNHIVLASDNPEFPKQETVQLSDIRCIYKASRIISQRIS